MRKQKMRCIPGDSGQWRSFIRHPSSRNGYTVPKWSTEERCKVMVAEVNRTGGHGCRDPHQRLGGIGESRKSRAKHGMDSIWPPVIVFELLVEISAPTRSQISTCNSQLDNREARSPRPIGKNSTMTSKLTALSIPHPSPLTPHPSPMHPSHVQNRMPCRARFRDSLCLFHTGSLVDGRRLRQDRMPLR